MDEQLMEELKESALEEGIVSKFAVSKIIELIKQYAEEYPSVTPIEWLSVAQYAILAVGNHTKGIDPITKEEYSERNTVKEAVVTAIRKNLNIFEEDSYKKAKF